MMANCTLALAGFVHKIARFCNHLLLPVLCGGDDQCHVLLVIHTAHLPELCSRESVDGCISGFSRELLESLPISSPSSAESCGSTGRIVTRVPQCNCQDVNQ